MEKQSSTKAGTPSLCVSVGDTWHWGLWVDLIPVPSLRSSFPQKKMSAKTVFIQFSQKKRLPPRQLQVCRNPMEFCNEGHRMWEEWSTPITSELWWKRFCHLSDRSLESLSIHRNDPWLSNDIDTQSSKPYCIKKTMKSTTSPST